MELTKDNIVALLDRNDKAVGRALLVLLANQTADEKATQDTRHLNGKGFKPCHAGMGTSMAQFFEKTGFLTEKQVAYWRKVERFWLHSHWPVLAAAYRSGKGETSRIKNNNSFLEGLDNPSRMGYNLKIINGDYSMSNINLVLSHLNTVGTISIRDAMVEYSLSGGALTKAISVLRKEHNIPIVKEMRKNPVSGRRYARYTLSKVA